jgi:hypothetical protein
MRWLAENRIPKHLDMGPAWEKWFAWYPVEICDEWVWLEIIWRRKIGSIWEYE